MSNYIKNLSKPLANLDELHDVMVDAYRKGVVLHYCLKCFQTFLTIEERQDHDKFHENELEELSSSSVSCFHDSAAL